MSKKILFTSIALLGLFTLTQAQDSAAFKGIPTWTGPGKGPIASYVKIATPIGSKLRLDTSFAVECRFFLDNSMRTGTATLVSSHGTSGGFDLKVVDKEIILTIYEANNSVAKTASFGSRDTALIGQWNYIGVSFNSEIGATARFINGKSLKGLLTKADPTPIRNENPFMRIGADGSTADVGLAVLIDEVRIWKNTRSTADMLTFQDSCFSGTHPNLLAHYTFEGVTDQNITDQSSNNNAGIITAYSAARIVDGAFSCGNSMSIQQTKAKSIKVYPNPAQNRVFVELEETNFSYTLTNVMGQVCLHGTNFQNGIDISNLKTGIFFLNLTNGTESYTQKIIKN